MDHHRWIVISLASAVGAKQSPPPPPPPLELTCGSSTLLPIIFEAPTRWECMFAFNPDLWSCERVLRFRPNNQVNNQVWIKCASVPFNKPLHTSSFLFHRGDINDLVWLAHAKTWHLCKKKSTNKIIKCCLAVQSTEMAQCSRLSAR